MLRNTLGQITFNQLVYALIAIIVLVVAIIIFSGNVTNQNNNMNSCQTQGGTCVTKENCNVADNMVVKYGDYGDCESKSSEGNTYVCCVKFLGN